MVKLPTELNTLIVFAAVLDAGRHHGSGPAAGCGQDQGQRELRRLEAGLGATLLNRTTRRVAPTDAGLRFYEHCAPPNRGSNVEVELSWRPAVRARRRVLKGISHGA